MLFNQMLFTRVGAGVERMWGGDACVAPVLRNCRLSRLRRPRWLAPTHNLRFLENLLYGHHTTIRLPYCIIAATNILFLIFPLSERQVRKSDHQAHVPATLVPWKFFSCQQMFISRLTYKEHVLQKPTSTVLGYSRRRGSSVCRPDERNHSETCAGCIVSCTTLSSCSRNWPRSTSLRNVALNASKVLAASYLRR